MYTAQMVHSADTFRRLAKVQYNAYCAPTKIGLVLIAAVCLYVGAFYSGFAPKLLLLVGCWVAVSIQLPARRNAERLIELAGGEFPSTAYRFSEDGLRIESGGETRELKYDQIYGLLEDGAYFYLFLNRLSGYMVPKSTLSPAGDAAFRSFLEARTGLGTESPRGLLATGLRGILLRRRNARARRARNTSS